MKRKNIIMGIFLFLGIIIFTNNVSAASYTLDFIPYFLPDSCNLEEDGGQECFEQYLSGEIEDYRITDGIVKPGDNIMIIAQLTPSEDSVLAGIKATISFDSSKLTYIQSSYGEEYGLLDTSMGQNFGIYPVTSDKKAKTNWNASLTIRENEIMLIASDSSNRLPLNKVTPFCALFFQVKDNVDSDIYFSYHNDLFKTNAADNNLKANGISKDLIFNSLTLKVDNNAINLIPYFSETKIENENPYIPKLMTNLLNNEIQDNEIQKNNLSKVENKMELDVNESKEIDLSLFSNIQWVTKDGNIVQVEDGVVTGISYGETEIQAIVTIPVRVFKKIVSNGSDVHRDPELSYVFAPLHTTLEDFISEFSNSESLHVYDIDGNEIFDYQELVGTGMTLKMIVDGEIQDSLTIVVKGDLTGDGYLSMSDFAKYRRILNELSEITVLDIKAGDIADNDGVITISDFMRMQAYTLKLIDSLE